MNFRILFSLLICSFILACSNANNQQSTQQEDNSAIPDTVETTQMKTILFFGNSLTAGYGLDDPNDAFPGLIQLKIDSLGLPYKTINAGLSGETSSGGKERIDWLLKQKIDVFVLELGANDGLRGLPANETYKSLQAIIDKVKAAWPDCKMVLTGMLVPPSMGQRYSEDFKAVFINLAKENNMAFVPFLLENVAGEVELNQGDGIHPTVEGQQILAENVWKVLRPIL
ncbi:arylesterase [Albibacterium bauzanense]|uniref:Acyl-CoA thioesterase-1 n=1 Tax=Albibacterium bauzanense TaxID=653929 RepID=A0A4V6NF59_9SPHI|nr:arylesterase [Albibacterium bauzanense]TCK85691.1 acyl-CoA thioesterase-1 [Albibacterium bauzanense]